MSNFRALSDGVSPGGSGGEYLFAGENALNLDNTRLDDAKQLMRKGMDNEAIRQKTGWFKGVDDKWRYEIPDGEMIENPVLAKDFDNDIGIYYTGKLSDIYDSPDLYTAYPEFKNTDIIIQDMPQGHLGNSFGNSIALNRNLYKTEKPEYLQKLKALENSPDYLNFKKYEDDIFAQMDNLDMSKELDKYQKMLDEYDLTQKEFYNNNPIGKSYADLVWHTPNSQKLTDGFGKEARKTLIHELQHLIQNKEGFAKGGSSKDIDYNKLAGEVEARTAERRSGLKNRTARRNVSPLEQGYMGYDVAPENQIVKFSNTGNSAEFNPNSKLYDELTKDLNYRDEWVKINGKDYRVLNLPKKDYGKILHILDTNLSQDIPIGEVLEKSDANYLYRFQKVSPTDYKFIKRTKLK